LPSIQSLIFEPQYRPRIQRLPRSPRSQQHPSPASFLGGVLFFVHCSSQGCFDFLEACQGSLLREDVRCVPTAFPCGDLSPARIEDGIRPGLCKAEAFALISDLIGEAHFPRRALRNRSSGVRFMRGCSGFEQRSSHACSRACSFSDSPSFSIRWR
jgi:hypothetical protein